MTYEQQRQLVAKLQDNSICIECLNKSEGLQPVVTDLEMDTVVCQKCGVEPAAKGFGANSRFLWRKFSIEFDPLTKGSVALMAIAGVILVVTGVSIMIGQSLITVLLRPLMGRI